MLVGFMTVRLATIHRQFLTKHGSSKSAHKRKIPSEVLGFVREELRYWAETPLEESWRPAACPTALATVAVDASTYPMAMHGRSQNMRNFFFSAPDVQGGSVDITQLHGVVDDDQGGSSADQGSVPLALCAGKPSAPVAMTVLADNVTTVQALNRLTTTSMSIADQMVPFVRWQAANHFWITGHYHPKILIDSQRATSGTTDQAFREFGGLWSRAIPAVMFDMMCSHFGVLKDKVIDMIAS